MDLNRQIYGRYTPEEWVEYCWVPQVRTNETPRNGNNEFGLACSILKKMIFYLSRVKNILMQEK